MKTSINDSHFGCHRGFFEIRLKISKPLESDFTSFIVPQNICTLDTLIFMIHFGMSRHKVQKNTYGGHFGRHLGI